MTTDAVRRATAVFSDAFQFPGHALDASAPEVIERDRLIMAARPGMLRKLLPVRQDDSGVYCGGVYLFDTVANAEAYGDWCANEFVLDGTLFLDRPTFLEPTAQVWQVIGAEDFADATRDQEIMRFERWHLPSAADPEALRRDWWPRVRKQAGTDGDTTVWLLLCPDRFHPQLGLVTARRRSDLGNRGRTLPDVTELERLPSPAADLAAELDATKVFDRTSWVYMVWHPIAEGETSPDTAQWPCSPPLPGLA